MTSFDFPSSFTAVYDTLLTQRLHGYPSPDWVSESVYSRLSTLGNVAFRMYCGAGNTTESRTRIRLRTGNMLRIILEKMEEKAGDSRRVEGAKILLYSGVRRNVVKSFNDK